MTALPPAVKSYLLMALVPIGMALSHAGMAALDEAFTARAKALADLKAEIATEAAHLDELRREHELHQVDHDLVEAELVGAAALA